MSETPAGRVLVVDTDYDTLEKLANALRSRGHHVVLAADGRGGLQRAVEIAADVVIVDAEVPVIDVRTFLEVLRDNPRTSGAHVFVMGRGGAPRMAATGGRAETLLKPFNAVEVAARVDEVLRARRAPQAESELRGDLAQVALFDLLQVFSANRRTGKLQVASPGASGEIWVTDGRIVDAQFGTAVGDKALFRALAITSGRFVFHPSLTSTRERIDLPTDHLLMEAVRQADEVARIRDDLPAFTSVIARGLAVPHASGMQSRVIDVLREPRSIEDLLDAISAPDLDVLKAVAELLGSGGITVLDRGADPMRLCDDEEVVAMRAAALRLRRSGVEGPVRLGVLCASAADATRFSRALATVREHVPASEPPTHVGEGAIGPIGALRLGATDLELFALPLDPPARPWWGTFLAPAAAVLVLADDVDESVEELLRQLDVRLVRAPVGWDRPAGAVAAVRAALGDTTPRTSSVPGPNGYSARR